MDPVNPWPTRCNLSPGHTIYSTQHISHTWTPIYSHTMVYSLHLFIRAMTKCSWWTETLWMHTSKGLSWKWQSCKQCVFEHIKFQHRLNQYSSNLGFGQCVRTVSLHALILISHSVWQCPLQNGTSGGIYK